MPSPGVIDREADYGFIEIDFLSQLRLWELKPRSGGRGRLEAGLVCGCVLNDVIAGFSQRSATFVCSEFICSISAAFDL